MVPGVELQNGRRVRDIRIDTKYEGALANTRVCMLLVRGCLGFLRIEIRGGASGVHVCVVALQSPIFLLRLGAIDGDSHLPM